jgi:hypothetical protein
VAVITFAVLAIPALLVITVTALCITALYITALWITALCIRALADIELVALAVITALAALSILYLAIIKLVAVLVIAVVATKAQKQKLLQLYHVQPTPCMAMPSSIMVILIDPPTTMVSLGRGENYEFPLAPPRDPPHITHGSAMDALFAVVDTTTKEQIF